MEVIEISSVRDRPLSIGDSTFVIRHLDECVFSGMEWQRIGEQLGLSQRELEVVQQIIEGKKLFAIAREMNLALGTVKTYSQRVHHKLGVGDQRQLTLAVMRAYLHLLSENGRLAATQDPPPNAIRA